MMRIKDWDLEALVNACSYQPHDYLGMHPTDKGLVVRVFLGDVRSCSVVDFQKNPERRYLLEKIHPSGFFEGFIKNRKKVFPYRLRVEQNNGEIRQFYDPYSFLPTLTPETLFLINKGEEHRIYEKLGSHVREESGIKGVSFAVWAPNADRVSVVGDFNHWDGRFHPMRTMGSSGIWELFIPGLDSGMKYKYELRTKDGSLRLKTDPYALYYESPPHNASLIWDIGDFTWSDEDWLEKRKTTHWQQESISIYEVHLGSWKRVVEDGHRPLTYREMADQLVEYVGQMGFTHVELMPIAEHPFSGSWGYQVTGFYAPTNRYGSPQDFMYLVNAFHQNGIGVLLDWVPAHFPRDIFALAEFDGSHLYEHADPKQGIHQDWDTLIFNYGRHEVRGFLVGSALAWMDRYHIDGLRVDAVASMLYLDYSRKEGEWIPNQYGGRENIEAIEFLRTTNDLVHQYYPGAIMIAEESTAFNGVTRGTETGGLGFDFKWNMGWMHDTLEYFKKEPIHRKWHHNQLTFGMLYQYSENFISVFSHDEVVHGKSSIIGRMGAWRMSDKAANVRALYTWMWMWPGKKTLFMGNEFGQSSEWHYDGSLDWHLLQYLDHEGIQRIVRDLNNLYTQDRSLGVLDYVEEGFQWVNCDDSDNSVYSFLRWNKNTQSGYLVVGNFTPVLRLGYRVGVPVGGTWKEVINSNASSYGGDNQGNGGRVQAERIWWDRREYSMAMVLPPMTTLVLRAG